MRWIITGTPDFREPEVLLSVMSAYRKCYGEPDEVISAGGKGADALGASWGRRLDIPVKEILPDWITYGNKARAAQATQIMEYAGKDGALFLFRDGVSEEKKRIKKQLRNTGSKSFS